MDDAPEVRRLVRTALRFRGGFEVVGEAEDGGQAVELAARLQPDIVVLDIGLPDLAGRDVLAGVRRASPGSKIVVFSGYDTPDQSWIAERVEGYLLKDAQLDYLVDLLEAASVAPVKFVTRSLGADPSSVQEARRFVRETLSLWALESLAQDAQLVVSELVTNAIIHAKSRPELRLSRHEGNLRVEVLDDGMGTPDPRPPNETDEGGRGLYLIGALTAAWGIEEIASGGKTVWAELRPTA